MLLSKTQFPQEKRKEEERERRKAKEKAKREQLKKEGKLLTGKAKAEADRLAAMRAQMLSQAAQKGGCGAPEGERGASCGWVGTRGEGRGQTASVAHFHSPGPFPLQGSVFIVFLNHSFLFCLSLHRHCVGRG